MKKVDTNVRELVGMIERGELRLPEMQRRYVWRAPRVRDLLDSLYRGYPSGSILVWETDNEQPMRDFSVPQQSSPFAGHKLLLDGQQRLTSLSAILRGEPIAVRGRKKPIDVLFNLEHPESLSEAPEVDADLEVPTEEDDDSDETSDDDEDTPLGLQERLRLLTFVVANKNLAAMPNWVSVSQVFRSHGDADLLKAAGISGFDDSRYAKYSARLARLRKVRDYPYVMHVLDRNLSYEEVAEIFVRVNSLGVKLRSSDLALAQITARWPNSLRLIEDFQEEIEDKTWFTFDVGLLVRAMVVFASGQCRFKSVNGISVKRLQEGWDRAQAGLRFAVNFLKSNAKIEDESLLSSSFFLIAIAYFAQQRNESLSESDERLLRFWLYVANARGRYSRGSSESILDADLATITKGGGPADLVESVNQQFGRLMFDPAEFVGRGSQSALFSLVYLALKERGAKDWRSGLDISLAHQGRLHYIQFHHIFPKSRLKGRYEKSEIHEIANMAFIAGGTNRWLAAKLPSEYIPGIVKQQGAAALDSQAVPTEFQFHDIERYRDFLDKRRLLLTQAVNAFLERARGIQ